MAPVRLKDCVDDNPTLRLPKPIVVKLGDKDGATPVPVKATVAFVAPLLLMVIVSLAAVVLVGVNLI